MQRPNRLGYAPRYVKDGLIRAKHRLRSCIISGSRSVEEVIKSPWRVSAGVAKEFTLQSA